MPIGSASDWQGRYRAKMVKEQRYLDQLLIYIHLNPVQAGLVSDPAQYSWSGHRELLGKVKNPIVDVDEVLRVFGTTRGTARAAYVRRLKGSLEETWVGEEPGRLPWWRLGRPPKGEDEDPETAIRERREREEMGPEWRPSFDASEFIARGAEVLGARHPLHRVVGTRIEWDLNEILGGWQGLKLANRFRRSS